MPLYPPSASSIRAHQNRVPRNLGGGSDREFPLTIPNLELWLRADLGVTLTAGKVSNWADQSGHSPARDAVQATAGNQPVVTASSLNGKPGLTFDGATSNRFMRGALPGIFADPWTLVTVSKMATGSQFGGILDVTSAAGNTNQGQLLLQNGGQRSYRYGNAADLQYSLSSTAGILNFAVCTKLGTNSQVSDIYEKTVLKNTTSKTVSSTLSLTQYRVGRLFQDVFPFEGDIEEVACYSKALSTAEIAGWTNYVVARYAI